MKGSNESKNVQKAMIILCGQIVLPLLFTVRARKGQITSMNHVLKQIFFVAIFRVFVRARLPGSTVITISW